MSDETQTSFTDAYTLGHKIIGMAHSAKQMHSLAPRTEAANHAWIDGVLFEIVVRVAPTPEETR